MHVIRAPFLQKGVDNYYEEKYAKGGSLYEKLKSDTTFSLFIERIDQAGIASFLDQGGQYTVFAPTNQALRDVLINGHQTPKKVLKMISSGEIWVSDTVSLIMKAYLMFPELFE